LSVQEPTLAIYGGTGLLASLRRWWGATRPQFLTASLLPVIVGSAAGARLAQQFDFTAALLAAFAVILLHAAANVWNDVGDEIGGSDPVNDGRIYPFTGGSRFIQNGVLGIDALRRLSASLLAAAAVPGVALLWRYGWPILGFGLAGVLLGLLYSLPRFALAGRGLGELAVALAFGLLPVTGAAWLQLAGPIPIAVLWLSGAVSGWVAAILLMNEVPDRAADAAVGKRTLPVRLGLSATAWLYRGLHALSLICALLGCLGLGLAVWSTMVPVLLFGLALLAAQGITGDRAALERSIPLTLAIHALGCGWLTLASLLA
jgi:1,4-dihydroxy-2-naphthoate octaprenyltransferase